MVRISVRSASGKQGALVIILVVILVSLGSGCANLGAPDSVRRCRQDGGCSDAGIDGAGDLPRAEPSVDAPVTVGSFDAPAPGDDGPGADHEPDTVILAPNGAPCVEALACKSGFCAGGVCCQTDCTGSCHACDQAGSVGVCVPIQAGVQPKDGCPVEDPKTCGQDGACDGNGKCRLHAAGVVCAPKACTAGVESAARTCDGLGACRPAVTKPCDPYVCTGMACASSCTDNTMCAGTSFCDRAAMKCDGLKPAGAACAAAGECTSGMCVDGVCCQSACTGTCRACNVAGAEGICTEIPAGGDPANECAALAASTCGLDGVCDGRGACRLHVAGTVCSAASCAAGTSSSQRTCDGAGQCRPAITATCAPYKCAATACASTCAADADCTAGSYCEGTACAGTKATGAACARAGQCASGFCADGVCCDAACTAKCTSCNTGGAAGTCKSAAAGSDPRNDCAFQDPSTCGQDGYCDGAGACRRHPGGTTCAAASCASGIETSARTCNGQGICGGPTTTSCSPYLCAGAACATTCAGAGGCASSFVCSNGKCVSPTTPGLVGYWKLDDGQGAVAADSSGNGNDGMLSGGATWSAGGFPAAQFANPYSLRVDGVDGHVVVPDPASGLFDFGTGSFSYSVWVYVDANTSPYDMPLYKGGASLGDPGFDIELGDGGWASYVSDGTSSGVVNFSGSPLLDQWVHLVGVRDAATGELRGYLNGSLVSTDANPPGSVSNDQPLYLGSQNTSWLLQGRIDDVRLYDRALSDADVAALYAGQ